MSEAEEWQWLEDRAYDGSDRVQSGRRMSDRAMLSWMSCDSRLCMRLIAYLSLSHAWCRRWHPTTSHSGIGAEDERVCEWEWSRACDRLTLWNCRVPLSITPLFRIPTHSRLVSAPRMRGTGGWRRVWCV